MWKGVVWSLGRILKSFFLLSLYLTGKVMLSYSSVRNDSRVRNLMQLPAVMSCERERASAWHD